jgi:glycosyltransferase involved in cell wall biosynthesis
LMVGDGPLRNQVISLLNDLGLLQYTIMTGVRRDIPRLISVMDVFLITSLWEGLPRVIPEAMLLGVPVVTSNSGGTAEVIQDYITGCLCAAGDTRALADRCIELLTDPEKRIRISKAAGKLVNRDFDVARMVNQIDKIYQELLDKHGKQIA